MKFPRFSISLLVLMTAIVIGCSRPTTIDGSSAEQFKKSILSLTKDLPQQEREDVMNALLEMNHTKGGGRSTLDVPNVEFLAYVNGKTLLDIKHDADIQKTKASIQELLFKFTTLQQQRDSLSGTAVQVFKEEMDLWSQGILETRVIAILRKLPITDIAFSVKDLIYLKSSTIQFTVQNNTENIVNIANANAIATFDKIEQTYILRQDSCFVDSLNKDKNRILPGKSKGFQCLVLNDLSGATNISINITGGSISNVGSYNDGTTFTALGSNRANELNDKFNSTIEKSNLVFVELKQAHDSLVSMCAHLSELANEQCPPIPNVEDNKNQ